MYNARLHDDERVYLEVLEEGGLQGHFKYSIFFGIKTTTTKYYELKYSVVRKAQYNSRTGEVNLNNVGQRSLLVSVEALDLDHDDKDYIWG